MKLDEDAWDEIRSLHGTMPLQVLARQYGISRAAIIKRAKRDNWHEGLDREVDLRVRERMTGITADASDEERETAVEVMADAKARMIRRHQGDWKNIYALRDDAFRIMAGEQTQLVKNILLVDDHGVLVDDKGKPVGPDTLLSRASKLLSMFEKAAIALTNAQEGERRSHGFDFRTQAESDRIAKEDRESKMGKISALLNALDARKQPKVIEGEVVK